VLRYVGFEVDFEASRIRGEIVDGVRSVCSARERCGTRVENPSMFLRNDMTARTIYWGRAEHARRHMILVLAVPFLVFCGP
jgi:hypothetical protein